MSTKLLKALGLGLLVVAGGAGIVALKRANASLREKIAGLAHVGEQREALRQENQRLQELLGRVRKEAAEAQAEFQAELRQAQSDLAAAEKSWRENRVRRMEKIAALAENTDPDRGIARLEHFKNVGRGTPAAALQTAVWAMMKREDAQLASAVSITGAAREKAEDLLNRLPAAERIKLPTPESLAVMAVTAQILRTEGMAVKEFTTTDGTHGTLTLRLPEPGRPENTKEGKVPMLLAPGGWQIVVPERAIDGIIQRISDQLPEPAKK